MSKFSLKKTAFYAVIGTLSVVAFQKLYQSKEKKNDPNRYRFFHLFPEDYQMEEKSINVHGSDMQNVSEENFVEKIDLPKKRVLKP